ncbi:hypothetical protein [Aquimarina muelleri]|uniref:Lipoprotein n=1 Tax=Aquimarina muelleri TaxID=279356 RepID=A0A918JTD6_9FLAO|nr:hypothetical protein [Aquimarina muelleri]MCX2764624.1 hypothetical protein [Aquimarina muelleri]GGX11309.1 hypothetical protein GCM10007384_11420 [Aquimarina muelleri]
MKYINLFFLFIITVFLSCKSSKQDIEIEQIETAREVMFRMKYDETLKKHRIHFIHIPIEFIMKNNLVLRQTIDEIRYEYLPDSLERKGITPLYSIINNNKLTKTYQFDEIFLFGKEIKKFLIETRHYAKDTIHFNDAYFKPYIDEMIENKTDTLLVGSFSDFKIKHSKLTNSLLSEDQIVIFVDNLGKEIKNSEGENVRLALKIELPIKF